MDEVRNIHNLRGFISAVNEDDGTFDVTYNDGQWDKHVAPKLLRHVTRVTNRRKSKQTWSMVPTSKSNWQDTAKLDSSNVIQGKRKRPEGSVYR